MSLLLNGEPRSAWPDETIRFCADFCRDSGEPKYILGRNIYSERLCSLVHVSAIIDDHTNDRSYKDLPIVKASEVPKNALVLNAAGGHPLSAKAKLDKLGLRNLDYFAFYKLSGLPLLPMRFNEGFEDEFLKNQRKFEWIYSLLEDAESRAIFQKLIRFRFDYDVSHLQGFTDRENIQYFEGFLTLNGEAETFVDIGAYDGYTSTEFIKRCPQYRAVHAFEPDPSNFEICSDALHTFPNTHCHPIGLSNFNGTVCFDVSGSASKISESGSLSVTVNRLDDVLSEQPTFVKMDIEGGEASALEGGQKIIETAHPRLAIAVYHSPSAFWQLPERILNIRDDYEIRLRHYTECIYETVMFFLPRK